MGSRFLTIFYSFVAGMDFLAMFNAILKNDAILSALDTALTIFFLWIAYIESKRIH